MSKLSEIREKNNRLDQELTPENRTIMTDMVVYLRVAPVTDIQVEAIRQDLLDMALSAQKRGEPLSRVFGEDGQAFCDEILANVRHRGIGGMLWQWFLTLCAVFSILAAIDFVFSGYLITVFNSIRNHTAIRMAYPLTAGFLINGLVVTVLSFGLVFLICKYSFRSHRIAKKLDSLSRPKKFIGGGLMGAVLFGYLLGIVELSRRVFVYVNVIVYLAAILLLFLVYKIFSNR